MSLIIDSIGGWCPFQAYGTFDGHPFYLRARGGEYRLAVVAPGEDPGSAGWKDGPTALHWCEGEDPAEGYMEPKDATAIVEREYRAWTKRRKLGSKGEVIP